MIYPCNLLFLQKFGYSGCNLTAFKCHSRWFQSCGTAWSYFKRYNHENAQSSWRNGKKWNKWKVLREEDWQHFNIFIKVLLILLFRASKACSDSYPNTFLYSVQSFTNVHARTIYKVFQAYHDIDIHFCIPRSRQQ